MSIMRADIIAEKIMEWTWSPRHKEKIHSGGPFKGDIIVMDRYLDKDGRPVHGAGFNPFESEDDALRMFRKIIEDGMKIYLVKKENTYHVNINNNDLTYNDKSFMKALCSAVWFAKGLDK